MKAELQILKERLRVAKQELQYTRQSNTSLQKQERKLRSQLDDQCNNNASITEENKQLREKILKIQNKTQERLSLMPNLDSKESQQEVDIFTKDAGDLQHDPESSRTIRLLSDSLAKAKNEV